MGDWCPSCAASGSQPEVRLCSLFYELEGRGARPPEGVQYCFVRASREQLAGRIWSPGETERYVSAGAWPGGRDMDSVRNELLQTSYHGQDSTGVGPDLELAPLHPVRDRAEGWFRTWNDWWFLVWRLAPVFPDRADAVPGAVGGPLPSESESATPIVLGLNLPTWPASASPGFLAPRPIVAAPVVVPTPDISSAAKPLPGVSGGVPSSNPELKPKPGAKPGAKPEAEPGSKPETEPGPKPGARPKPGQGPERVVLRPGGTGNEYAEEVGPHPRAFAFGCSRCVFCTLSGLVAWLFP